VQDSIRIVKRMMDVIGAATGLALGAPFMGAIAAAIKATSRGPVIYSQRRAGMIDGENGVNFDEFEVYKFRTMVDGAESMTGAVLAEEDDPRVTEVGHFLRRTRLDELPQLVNVLKGDMSLVGPRPERPEMIRTLAMAIPFFEERMRLIKPGITGLAQVELSYTGRMRKGDRLARVKDTLLNPFDLEGVEDSVADDMRTKMLYDFVYSAYLESFWEFFRTDVGILFKTPYVMFFSRTGQ